MLVVARHEEHPGQLSAGDRDLNVPRPTVSCTISILEKDIDAALFTRTTRAVNLTGAGADVVARVETIRAEREKAERVPAAVADRIVRGK